MAQRPGGTEAGQAPDLSGLVNCGKSAGLAPGRGGSGGPAVSAHERHRGGAVPRRVVAGAQWAPPVRCAGDVVQLVAGVALCVVLGLGVEALLGTGAVSLGVASLPPAAPVMIQRPLSRVRISIRHLAEATVRFCRCECLVSHRWESLASARIRLS